MARAGEVRARRLVAFEDIPDGQRSTARESTQRAEHLRMAGLRARVKSAQEASCHGDASADPFGDQRLQPTPRISGQAVAATTTRADRARWRPPRKQAHTHTTATATRANNRRQPPAPTPSPTRPTQTAGSDKTGRRTRRGTARKAAPTAAAVTVRKATGDASAGRPDPHALTVCTS